MINSLKEESYSPGSGFIFSDSVIYQITNVVKKSKSFKIECSVVGKQVEPLCQMVRSGIYY